MANCVERILKSFMRSHVGPVPTPEHWAAIEKSIGRRVPDDFKAIVEFTGGCKMGHCYPRNPAVSDNIYLAFSHAALQREYILKRERALEELRIDLYPEPGGWIQIAKFDEIDFMLKPDGEDIEIADYSGLMVYRTGKTFSELMWALFEDRQMYDGIGASNWHNSDKFFWFPSN